MQLDAVQLGDVRPLVFLVGAGGTVAERERQIPPRLVGIHGVEHFLLVPHQAVQLVFHALGGVLAGGRLGGRVGQQVQHARRLCPRKTAAFVPRQAEQVEQHLTVQAAVDLFQVQLFAAGLVIHHPHPAGAVFFHPFVRPIHRADELHRPPVREMIGLPGDGILPPADLQFTGHRAETGLPLLIPQVAQKACHALFQAGEQVGKAGSVLRQIALGVLVHQQGGQRRHGLVVQLQKRRHGVGAGVVRAGVRVQCHLQHPVHQGAALVGGKLCPLAGAQA